MNEIIEYIEDLETLDSLDTVSKEAHLEFLINKYRVRFQDYEEDMARQMELDIYGS